MAEPLSDLATLIANLSKAGGVPITLSQAPPPKIDTGKLLTDRPRLTVAFPPCADELLSLIKTSSGTDKDEVITYFQEYFKFLGHKILGQVREKPEEEPKELNTQLRENMDNGLLKCRGSAEGHPGETVWPTECCLCRPCVTLNGNRNALTLLSGQTTTTPTVPVVKDPEIKRLFIGDLVWLFYFERMGIFQILGVILDAFACNGRLPISNGSLDPGVKDDITALVLEVMVRQTKMGMSSTVRDRGCAYQTALGWTSPTARKLGLDTQINTGFNNLFHKFIFNALEYYKDKRLAVAIQGTVNVARPSVATLITVSDTLDVLKKRFEAFSYGRNYYNTLSGIVWTIAGMSVIRELRTTLGIPPAYNDPHEFIPAAYDLLVMKRPVTYGETNRYLLHRECARNGRDILLDMEMINHGDRNPGGELEIWLMQIEAKIEGYRTAYRTLTGVDLGASATPVIEHQM